MGRRLPASHHLGQLGGDWQVRNRGDCRELGRGAGLHQLLPRPQHLLVLFHLYVCHQLGLPHAAWKRGVEAEGLRGSLRLGDAVSEQVRFIHTITLTHTLLGRGQLGVFKTILSIEVYFGYIVSVCKYKKSRKTLERRTLTHPPTFSSLVLSLCCRLSFQMLRIS